MPRYYYTCPIKAAYMVEYHGLDFKAIDYKTDISEPLYIKELLDFDYYLACQQYPKENKIYLKKGSEYLIEPKKGDIGIERNLHSTETCYFGGKYWAYENEEKQTTPHQQRVKIIYRDGTEFFMPEVEND